MSRTLVKAILQDIEALGDADRLALERALARRVEGEWKAAAGKARRVARRRKIDQGKIDRAIERRRYGI